MVLVAASLSGCWVTGEGEKVGVITKLAKEGSFIGTWEAEIVRGGLTGGSGVNGQSFHFTIENEKLVKQVEAAMEAGNEVQIKYVREKFAPFRSETGNNFLKSITIIKRQAVANTGVTTQVAAVAGRDVERIKQLLAVQAQLIQELAK